MEEVALGTGVAKLIRLIGSRKPDEPTIEPVNEPLGKCVHFPGDQEVEHEQPVFVHAWTEASKPGLPSLPAGDGTVHDAGHEDAVDLTNADWDCQEIRLGEEGLRAVGRGLLRSDAQAFTVDVEAYDGKAALCQGDRFATHAGTKH